MLVGLRDFIRPLSVAALLAVLILGAITSGIMEALMPGLGVRFTGGVAGWFRAIPQAYYNLATAFGLGYIGAREVGKVAKQWAATKKPAVDDPDT